MTCKPPVLSGNGQDRGRFPKGQSGNPSGRPPGARNRTTVAAEALLEGEAEALTRKAIDLALAGDTAALRLCLDRVVPQRRSRATVVDLPPIDRAEDLPTAIGAVIKEATGGRLLLDDAAALVGMMEAKRRALETTELEERLKALEAGSAEQEAAR